LPLGALELNADSLVTLPIVVHVLHTGTAIGAPDNPTDANIHAMVALLNNTWRKQGPQYGGADMRIQFALAKQGPNCQPTTGINRVNAAGITNYATGGMAIETFSGSADERALKAISRWPSSDYINIWIVNRINGSNVFPGGFAWFPQYASPLDDGITILANTVDGTNGTIVHEMGHAFFLYHTFETNGLFGSCNRPDSCSFYGDLVCDTENHTVVKCGTPQNTCTNAPFAIADIPLQYSVLHNYMGYSNCQRMFTQGQKARARWALAQFKPGLLSSQALQTNQPAVAAAIPACAPAAASGLSPYFGVEMVTIGTATIYSNTSEADGGRYVDRTCNQRVMVNRGQILPLKIAGSYGNWHYLQAYADWNNDGDFADAGETLLQTAADIVATSITIPNVAPLNTMIRLRIVADNINGQAPGACQLNGNVGEGSGQIEDYALAVVPRQITSVKTGNWTDASTWSCGCIPQAADAVIINTNHQITLTPAMGPQQCYSLHLNSSGRLNCTGSLLTKKL
jgi:hypothetical protein